MDPTLARRVAPEDLVQETLLEATRKIGEFEPVAETAERLNSTEAAVKSLVSRGMQELAGRVEPLE